MCLPTSSLLASASANLVEVGDWVVWVKPSGADYGQLDSNGRVFFAYCKGYIEADAALLSECVSFLEWHEAHNYCASLRA